MKYQILTQFDYPEEYPHLKQRMDIFWKYTYPSIMNQTDKDFEWILITSGTWTDKVKDLKIPGTTCMSFGDVRKQNDVRIQTRIDNDDLLLPDYVKEIKKVAEEGYALDFGGYRIHQEDKKVYTDKSYHKYNLSPMLTAVDSKCVWDIAWHANMHKVRKIKILPQRMWIQHIHPYSWTMSKKKSPEMGDYVCELSDLEKILGWKV